MTVMKEDSRLASLVNTVLDKFHDCIDLGSEKGQELCAQALFACGIGLKHGEELKSLSRGDISYAREHLFDLNYYRVYSPSIGVYVSHSYPAVYHHSNEMVSSHELFLAQLHFTPGQLLCLSDFEILMYDAAYFYALNAMDLSTYSSEDPFEIRNHIEQQLQNEIFATLCKRDDLKFRNRNSSDSLLTPCDQDTLRQTLCCNRFHHLCTSLAKNKYMMHDLESEFAAISNQYQTLNTESSGSIIDEAMVSLRTFVLRRNAIAHYKQLSRSEMRYKDIKKFEEIPTTYADLQLYLRNLNIYHFAEVQKTQQQIADYQTAMALFDKARQRTGRESPTLEQFMQLAEKRCGVRHRWGEAIYALGIPTALWDMEDKHIEEHIAYMHLYADLIERCKEDASEQARCFEAHGLNLLNYSIFLNEFKKEHFFPSLQEKYTHLLQRPVPSNFEELLQHMSDLYSLNCENWNLNTTLEKMAHILDKRDVVAPEFHAPVAMYLERLAEKEQAIDARCKVQITADCQNLKQCFERYKRIMPNEAKKTAEELLDLCASNQPIWQNLNGIALYELSKKIIPIMTLITKIDANASNLNKEYNELLEELKTAYRFLNEPEIADGFSSAQAQQIKQTLNTVFSEENPTITLETLRALTLDALSCVNHYKEQFLYTTRSVMEARQLLPTIYTNILHSVSILSDIEEASHIELEAYSQLYPYITIVNERLRLKNISEKTDVTADEKLLIESAMTVVRLIDHNLEQSKPLDLESLKISSSLLQYTNKVLDSALRIEDGAFPQSINAFDRSKFEPLIDKRRNDNAKIAAHRIQMAIGAMLLITSLIIFVTMCGLDAGLSYHGAVLALSLMTKSTVYAASAGGVIAGGYIGYTNRYRLHREITQQQRDVADIEKIQNFGLRPN